jgi:hypothetical protein
MLNFSTRRTFYASQLFHALISGADRLCFPEKSFSRLALTELPPPGTCLFQSTFFIRGMERAVSAGRSTSCELFHVWVLTGVFQFGKFNHKAEKLKRQVFRSGHELIIGTLPKGI